MQRLNLRQLFTVSQAGNAQSDGRGVKTRGGREEVRGDPCKYVLGRDKRIKKKKVQKKEFSKNDISCFFSPKLFVKNVQILNATQTPTSSYDYFFFLSQTRH